MLLNGKPLAKHRQILIAEDDEDLAQVIGSTLASSGCHVIRANRLPDAITKLKNQRFDCAIVDIRLEGGSGEKIVEFMREPANLNQRTPVLVVSGFLNPALLQRLGGKINGALAKPFERDSLMMRIEDLLKT